MTIDHELKAMSEVFNALQGLDENTQNRVVSWVLHKLESSVITSTGGAKRGPKPSSKRGKKRGRKPGSTSATKINEKKVPKPKLSRGSKPASGRRPKGSAIKSSGGRRGRPRKNAAFMQE